MIFREDNYSLDKCVSGRKYQIFLVILLMIMAIGLRLISIGRDSFWFDEAISYLATNLPVKSLLDNTIQDPHPPLFYLLLKFWLGLVPSNDVTARLFSLIWNVLLVPVVYLLTDELLQNRRLALFSSLLVVISPFHILYSQELRMYTQLMFLTTLGVYCYVHAIRSVNSIWWIFYTFVFTLAIYTHLFALLTLFAINVFALIHHNQRKKLGLTLATTILLLALFIPWVAKIIADTSPELGSLRPLNRITELNPALPASALTFLIFGLSDKILYSALALFLTIAIGIIILIEAYKVWQENIKDSLLLPILLVIFILGIPVAVYYYQPFFLPERTLAAASPFIFILMAWGITRKNSPLPYLVLLSVILMITGSLMYLTGSPVKPPYREAIQYVESQRNDTDAIIHTSNGSYLPSISYVDIQHHALLDGDPDPRKPSSVYHALGGEIWSLERVESFPGRLWLMVAYEHSLEWQQEQVNNIVNNRELMEHYNFGGIEIYLLNSN